MPPHDPQLEKALQEHADSLTTHLTKEVENLRKIQEVRERAREATAVQASKAATSADTKLQILLDFYQAQDEHRAHRRRFYLRFVLPSALSAVLGGGGVTTWLVATDDTPKKPTTTEIKQTIEDRVNKLEQQQGATGQRVERLGDLHFENQELWLDGIDRIDQRLDAIGERVRVQTETPPEPETISRAREQVKAYRRRKEHREVEKALKKGDPFAGLDPLDPQNPPPPIVEPDPDSEPKR